MNMEQITKALLMMMGWSAILYTITAYVKKYVNVAVIQKWLPVLPVLLGAGSGVLVIDYILQLVSVTPPEMSVATKAALYSFFGVGAGASSVASHEVWQRRKKGLLQIPDEEETEDD